MLNHWCYYHSFSNYLTHLFIQGIFYAHYCIFVCTSQQGVFLMQLDVFLIVSFYFLLHLCFVYSFLTYATELRGSFPFYFDNDTPLLIRLSYYFLTFRASSFYINILTLLTVYFLDLYASYIPLYLRVFFESLYFNIFIGLIYNDKYEARFYLRCITKTTRKR